MTLAGELSQAKSRTVLADPRWLPYVFTTLRCARHASDDGPISTTSAKIGRGTSRTAGSVPRVSGLLGCLGTVLEEIRDGSLCPFPIQPRSDCR
jgi:hypothetical protein